MRYTILLHYPEAMAAGELDEATVQAGMAAFQKYAADLDAAGLLISAEVLADSSATTTLRSVDGEFRIQDGPFADTKEQLAGTFVIDVADLDAALGWAKQAPSVAWGPVEVRPGMTHWQDGGWRARQ
ncbi:YciI family protein [Frankia sp. AgB1.9]|uniref:YciI family protein n=1 Tax=unclassified Frankia TaxID=2632575 RepID=UPI0019319CCE|nr:MULTISPECIES: YciI family protein [unclassified Frankia]MBL7494674.1 YciI family protein [Frankia sp. AgW1.1]MBL7553645.1 YciI family protein [Frankia sp. AgB1.9]MBL7617659.1 YciI family protein [Frankia sp. AgB1.8]